MTLLHQTVQEHRGSTLVQDRLLITHHPSCALYHLMELLEPRNVLLWGDSANRCCLWESETHWDATQQSVTDSQWGLSRGPMQRVGVLPRVSLSVVGGFHISHSCGLTSIIHKCLLDFTLCCDASKILFYEQLFGVLSCWINIALWGCLYTL